ncbi:hypothetical protein [Micromonospora rubida]|uniref:hypothetical protein n=1 Tax=Micromonospora rubida TaxID=2697657 RepID=UPI0013770C71|nr:hypothetical protein [Micromonospora rubida]NBE79869.1 hypothetical protein [Micromonospora rubida]
MARIRKRMIRVDGVDYQWVVRHVDAGHVAVMVRHIATGRGTQLEVQVAFDDPWLNYGPIITAPPDRVAEVFALAPVTPQLVAELIQAALAAGWQVDGVGGPLRFTLSRDHDRLEPVS